LVLFLSAPPQFIPPGVHRQNSLVVAAKCSLVSLQAAPKLIVNDGLWGVEKMFDDMHLVLAWFGFIFLMLLFKMLFVFERRKQRKDLRSKAHL
jgi:hypothetical protein